MKKGVLILGGGKIGDIISAFLQSSGDYAVTVADRDETGLARLKTQNGVETLKLDVTDEDALLAALDGKWAVLSALPYDLTPRIARAAAKAEVNYFDLTEDVASTRMVKDLAKDAPVAFMPQSGLAPGFVSIVAYDLARKFDSLLDVNMRVGALAQYPTNALKYNLTWSTEGLINEYCEPCEAIVDGAMREVPPLEELENITLDGIAYEAFNTSGGLGTMCETLAGKVRNLNYKSIRYPGHREMAKMLIKDLRMNERQDLLKEIFEHALPSTGQDVVFIFVQVSGMKNGRLVQETFSRKVYNRTIDGREWTGIQITTASGVCGVLDLMANGKLPQKGFVRQEDVNFDDFITNRFGRNYSAELAAGQTISEAPVKLDKAS
jgi:saccharopine dehydrogenase-like NADP-dependent oxidoreductase